jgi:hypothetical protein
MISLILVFSSHLQSRLTAEANREEPVVLGVGFAVNFGLE